NRGRGRLRVRLQRVARAHAADGVAPSEEVDGRRLARARAARQVGVFLVEAGGGRGSRRCRRPERGVLLMATNADELRDEVRRRYAESARAVTAGSAGCGSGSCCTDDSSASAVGSAKFGEVLYDVEQRGELPDAAVLASLGCGNPTAVADLREGETVLDLGSGGGIDVILSARRVGPSGIAYGLDMTDEMLALATG